MADYYAVLKRTLTNFGEPSQSLRTKIYDKARATITRQLDATDPPLAPETKAAQLAQLDEAIARMEAEYEAPRSEFIGDPPPIPSATPADVLEPAPEPEPTPEPMSEPVPEAVEQPSEPDPEPATELPAPHEPEPILPAENPPVPPAEVTAEPPVDFDPPPAEPLEAHVEPAPPAEEIGEAAAVAAPAAPPGDRLAEAFAAVEAARAQAEAASEEHPEHQAEVTALPTFDPPPADDGEGDRDEGVSFDDEAFSAAAAAVGAGGTQPVEPIPSLEPSHLEAGPEPEARSEPEADTGALFDDPERARREAEALEGPPVVPPRERRGSGRGVLWFLLLVAALGLLFVFRQPLLGAVGVSTAGLDRFVAGVPVIGPYLVGEFDDPDDPTRPKPVPTIRITPEPEPVAPVEDAGKREERLGADGQEIGTAPEPRTVDPQPAPELPAPTVPVTPEPSVPEPAADEQARADAAPGAEPALPEPVQSDSTAPAGEADGAERVAVAQSAILYEEGSGSRPMSTDRGNVVWSLVREGATEGDAAVPAIRAALDMPSRELKATITLRRNTDKALTASHLVEVNFQPAPGFSGNNVDEVLALRMRPDERTQGEQLSAVPAKVGPGYFFVALESLPKARERNVSLLRGGKWLDIGVEYATGRRALVSLEKGVAGEQVFSEAFAAWDAVPAE